MGKMKGLVLLLVMVLLVGCGTKNEAKETATTSEVAEEQVVKTQSFELEMANGQIQEQTVIYKGEKLQKVILRNELQPTPEITDAINGLGVEETKRLLGESMAEDPAYQELGQIEGLAYELQSTDDNELILQFTLDVPNLDADALGRSEIFQGSGLADLDNLKAKEYLKRLEAYGAKPVTP
ncbi:SP0191 family lipoprotein [Streptococcus rifensis]